jgi:tRNA threonylcarbamoyladenosine biosynthesis protein TsaB
MTLNNLNNAPIILAIETATEACSAALAIGNSDSGTKIITRFAIAPREHTKLILTMMDEVLAEAGVKLAQVDAVAFSRGPGAFTGVRIATGVAHGVALAIDKPLLPISTLAAIAQQMHQQQGAKHCLAAIDARMQEVYWGRYAVKKGVMTLQGEETVSKPNLLQDAALIAPVSIAKKEAFEWIAAGSGWDAYTPLLNLEALSTLKTVANILPSAEYIATLAIHDWLAGKAVEAEQAQPIYLRDKVAQTIAERNALKN